MAVCQGICWPSFSNDIDRAGCGEIAVLHEIGSFGDVNMVDDFGDKPVNISISLSMSIVGKIHRNAIHENREIRSMIGIESSNEILVGFAASLMLHGV